MRVEKKKYLPIDYIGHSHNSEGMKDFIPLLHPLFLESIQMM